MKRLVPRSQRRKHMNAVFGRPPNYDAIAIARRAHDRLLAINGMSEFVRGSFSIRR